MNLVIILLLIFSHNLFIIEEIYFYKSINNSKALSITIINMLPSLSSRCIIQKYNINILYYMNFEKVLKNIFVELFSQEIILAQYESIPTIDEPKYSCHIVVENIRFSTIDCKILSNYIINKLKTKICNIIDPSVYGIWRSLRIEKSTKIGSKRKKVFINDSNNEYNYKHDIHLNGLITNLSNTQKLIISESIQHQNKVINNYNILINNKNQKADYNILENDIKIVEKRWKEIETLINNWHYKWNTDRSDVKIFITTKIIKNMIILKRLMPFVCPQCNRIHEKQHPYIYVKSGYVYFHCRRSPKPIKIDDIIFGL